MVTGDLNIFKNKNVRYLTNFCTKFRINIKINYKSALKLFSDDIDCFI